MLLPPPSLLNAQSMATRKAGTSLQAINAQIAALQAKADALRKKEVSGVVAKIKDAIAHYGLTAADLGLGNPASKPARAAKAAKKTLKAPTAGKSGRPAKYQSDQGHTWGGMGKRPAWFKEALAAGKTAEDLLIKH